MLDDVRMEPFDVLTAEGTPTGQVKPRWQVHRDGDWHRSFHCWVAWPGRAGRAHAMVQRRSPDKDVAANQLDVAVGGHYRAGETLGQVVREVEEELGLAASLDDLVPIGRRRSAYVGDGAIDREVQDVFVYALPERPTGLRVEPGEISALYDMDVEEVLRLFDGDVTAVACHCAPVYPAGRLGAFEPTSVTMADFIAVDDDYWRIGFRTAARALAGERNLDIGLW